MKKKDKKFKKIQIEFDAEHLPILINALETYSRLQSGQISMAMDTVYGDRNLSWDEREYLENVVRYVAFPPNPRREYDGHGGFDDQYNNQYDENGNIVEESEEWKSKKNRPHLDHANSSFGVGCKEMKQGTIAWEIKKAIEEFLHYERNDGYRDMGVDGDGVLNISGLPNAKIIDPNTGVYWRPEKWFLIPKRYQEKVKEAIFVKDYEKAWKYANKSLTKANPLFCASKRIDQKDSNYYLVLEKPYKK